MKSTIEKDDLKDILEDTIQAQTLLRSKTQIMPTSTIGGERLLKLKSKGQLDLNPWFQRGDVWKKDQKAKLVDSFISKTPIPAIYLELYKKEKNFDYYRVIDGKQRLTALFEFVEGGFALEYEGQPEKSDFKGKKWSGELELQEVFESSQLSVFILDTTNCTDEERKIIERYVFLRWNSQTSMRLAELRHAEDSFLNKMIDNHLLKFFLTETSVLKMKNTNMQLNEVIERLLYRFYPTDVSHEHPTHRKLTTFHRSAKDERLEICKTDLMWAINILNVNKDISQMKKLIKNSYKIDLVIILVHLRRKYGVTRIENIVTPMIKDFIDVISKHKDLNPKDKSNLTDDEKLFLIDINELMDKYRGGINGSNKARFDKWDKILSKHYPQNELDSKRVATREEKELIWWKQDKKCKICGQYCDLDDSEADHITEYKLGGSSKLEDENFQVIHKSCHKEKTRKFMSEKILAI